MLKVPSNTVDEANSEFYLYKRTLLRGRVPVKLVSSPTDFVQADYETEVNSTDSDILFLVCTNAVEVVEFKYQNNEWVTIDTFFVPFQAQNAASISIPNWKNSFALLISCVENILLVLEYSYLTQTLTPHRMFKFEQPEKDLPGTHLCVDPYSHFVFFGSLGETHYCICRDFFIHAGGTYYSGSMLFPSCEVISQNTVGVNSIHLTNKLVRDVTFCVEYERQMDVRTQVLAILLVDCLKKKQYIYFYTFNSFEHSLVFKYEIPLHDLTRETVSLRSELMLWNTFSLLPQEKKLAVLGRDKILLISLEASWLYKLRDSSYDGVDDKQSFREQLKSNCDIIDVRLLQDDIQQTSCIAFASSCACIARRGGIRYFAFFDDGTLLGLKLGSHETQATATSVLVAQEIPNKNILFADKRNQCGEDELHGFYFYAISSTRGLLSFHFKWDGKDKNNLFRCEKLSEIPFHSPVLYVSQNATNKNKGKETGALFTSAFGMESHSGIWELYKHIPLESLSHHEEQWQEECIKILCLPCNASDSYDSLVVISFLHSTRVLQYDSDDNCFLENNQINLETMQSTVYCTCLEDENYLQVHKGGIRLSLLTDDKATSNREIVDWNPLPQLEIIQATSEKNVVAVQWSQQHYQIYLLKLDLSTQTIQVTYVLSLSYQISYFCLQLTMEDPRIWIGTYEGTLELYSLMTMNPLFRFSLDNLVLDLPKCRSSQVDVPDMITTRVESLICRNERIFVGTRDGYLWILTFHDSTLQVCYGKSLGTAPLQLFLWSTDGKHTSMLLGLSGHWLWWISERNERFYFQMLYWDHIVDGELSSGACISCPFRGWSEYPTLFLSISKQLALLQVPYSDRPSDIWYSKIYYTSPMTLKVQKYFITHSDGLVREEDVNILVVRKATRANFHSSYEVQAWTHDMKTMLAHLVLPSHTAVTSVCVWKQFLLIGATEESILYSDIRMPNTKGRVVLLQLVRTKHDEMSCRFMVNCEFLLPGAVMVVTPLNEETLLVSCNEHLLAFAMDPQEQTLMEIARGETRGLILAIHVEYPFIFVGDRKDSVHIYYIRASNHEIVPICQDEYRKLVVSLATQHYHDYGQLVFVGDRQSMLHVLWCPFSESWNGTSEWNDSLEASHHISLMTCLCSVPWKEIPIHLSSLTCNLWDTGLDGSAILACSNKLMVTSMDGTWSQLVFIRSGYAQLLWKLQRVIDQFFRCPVDSNNNSNNIILDGDRLVWFLSSKYTSMLSDWGNFTKKETLQLLHLLYFLEDLVYS
ncbi:hypothetical protein GpartN1_g727.t1 [Galdieria partita]|uniref:DNA damage-binding protein 1 n=1 Tax=Galdieria partita TaxID=83374 RepID=A0A9C7UN17_9RHOD|nr:hypothetical protein GpartN1_g727.t1 [Galdieria partita]